MVRQLGEPTHIGEIKPNRETARITYPSGTVARIRRLIVGRKSLPIFEEQKRLLAEQLLAEKITAQHLEIFATVSALSGHSASSDGRYYTAPAIRIPSFSNLALALTRSAVSKPSLNLP
jgi:hypothetical protein